MNFLRQLSPTAWAFGLGLAAGLVVAAGCHKSDQVALQNTLAALDSTRRVAAGNDSVSARLLLQRDVFWRSALAKLDRERRKNAQLEAQLKLRPKPIDTTVSHVVPPDSIRQDSLVLTDPPVLGQVNVTITTPQCTGQLDSHQRPWI